ncbi:MAG: YdaU family protein [Proteobacteria bacterium]|nr:YdaU family protein [Pseudomonadota bacterium]
MSARPWYKRYPSDFISGTLRMSLEEKGAYSMVLDLIYDCGGPIPDDPQWVARVCGCSTRKWNQIKSKLVEFGKIEVVDGHIYNARANYELNGRRTNGKQVAEKSAKTRDKPEIDGSKTARKLAENETVSNKTNGLGFSISESRVQSPESRSQKPEKNLSRPLRSGGNSFPAKSPRETRGRRSR